MYTSKFKVFDDDDDFYKYDGGADEMEAREDGDYDRANKKGKS